MIDWGAFTASMIRGALAGMTESAALIANRAKDKAPVRRIHAQADLQVMTRLKTEDEISADVEIRQRLGMRSEHAFLYPPSIVTHRANQYLTHRTIGQIDTAELSARGRYEVRTERAAHQGQIGGRLRDEITATTARLDGSMIVAEVESPTPYAKQQELGNRHNPAHPYLRPAGYESHDDVRTLIGKNIAASARIGLSTGGRTRITIRLKAGAGANGR